jgi:hypothetical protein
MVRTTDHAVLHFDETHAVAPLERVAEDPAPALEEETFPSGL